MSRSFVARRDQAWAVALYELRRLRRGRHALGRLLLVSTPVLLSLLIALAWSTMAERLFVDPVVIGTERHLATQELMVLATAFRFLDLPIIVYLAAATLFANLYHAELSDRTLHHLFLLPVEREIVTIGKFVAAALSLFVATLVAWTLSAAVLLGLHGFPAAFATAFSLEGLGHLASYAVMLLLATLAYGSLFLLVGGYFRSPALVALAFFGWEWLSLFLPTSFKRATIIHWISSFLPVAVTPDSVLATIGERENRLLAILVLLLFTAACLAAATWRARRIQVSYGASE